MSMVFAILFIPLAAYFLWDFNTGKGAGAPRTTFGYLLLIFLVLFAIWCAF
jgi:cytochrome b